MSLSVGYSTYANENTDWSSSDSSSTETIDLSSVNVTLNADQNSADQNTDVSSDESDNDSVISNTSTSKLINLKLSKPNYKLFCIVLGIACLFWITMLIIAVFLYISTHNICHFGNGFELFGICLLVYINLRYLFDLICALIMYWRYAKYLVQQTYWKLMTGNKVQSNAEISNTVADSPYLSETVSMSKQINLFKNIDSYIQEILQRKELPLGDNFSQENLMSALNQLGNIKEKWTNSTAPHKHTNLRTIHKIKLSLESVPLLSVVFYFIIGLNTSHNNIYKKNTLVDSKCQYINIFNWILVCIFIFQSMFKLLPSLVCMFYKYKPMFL